MYVIRAIEEGAQYFGDRVRCQNLILHPMVAARFADHCEVSHSIASRHSLPCSRLPADYDGLVLVVSVWIQM